MNPLLEAAKEIGDSPEENTSRPRRNNEIDAWQNPELVDNGDASFERFMASFGTPTRWAGR